jgi:hypothetical protein
MAQAESCLTAEIGIQSHANRDRCLVGKKVALAQVFLRILRLCSKQKYTLTRISINEWFLGLIERLQLTVCTLTTQYCVYNNNNNNNNYYYYLLHLGCHPVALVI